MNSEFSTKNIFRLAWPTIISQATFLTVGIIDLLFVGQLGTAAIAAVAISNSFIATFYQFMEGIRTGTTVLTARNLGAEDKSTISKILNLSIIFSLFIGIIITIFAPIISNIVYAIAKSPEAQAAGGEEYLNIRLLETPAILLFLAITGFFRGLENTLIPLMGSLFIFAANIILDYSFIYGKFGMPVLGVTGAAWATLIANVIGAIAMIVFLYKSQLTKNYLKLIFKFKQFKKDYIKIVTEIGIFMGISSLAFLIFMFLFSRLGTQTIAAHQITFQVFLISYLPPHGFLVATTIIIGKIFGEKRKDLIIPATLKIMFICFIFMSIASVLLFAFSYNIAQIFSPKDEDVVLLATSTIRLISIEQLLATFYLIIRGALTAAKDTRFLVYVSFITSYIIFLPTSYFLGITLELGIFGGYLGFMVWALSDSLFLSWRFFIQRKWAR